MTHDMAIKLIERYRLAWDPTMVGFEGLNEWLHAIKVKMTQYHDSQLYDSKFLSQMLANMLMPQCKSKMAICTVANSAAVDTHLLKRHANDWKRKELDNVYKDLQRGAKSLQEKASLSANQYKIAWQSLSDPSLRKQIRD